MPQQQVNIPGVGIVKFPDTMSRAEIDAASKKLHDEASPPMKWPPGEPSQRGAVGRVMDSMFDADYRRPEVSPEARPDFSLEARDEAERYAPPVGTVGLVPTAAEISGGTFSNIPEPRRTQLQQEWQRKMGEPLIPLGEMAEKMYPDRPDEGLAYQWERGFGIGINRLAGGFTSPTTIATVIAAMGAGAVSQTLKILIGIGFTSEIAANAIVQSPEIVQLVKEGRTSDAVAKGTEVAGSLLLAGTIGRHTLKAGASHPLTTGRGMVLDPRGPGGAGRPTMEPRVFEEGAGLEVLPAHEGSLFPGRPTELPGTPATGQLPPISSQGRPGVPGVPSTQGIYSRGTPPEPGIRGLLPEAPGYDIPGAGPPGRLFRGGARMGEPAPTMTGEPRVTAEQTVVPTGRPQGLFGEDPSNLLRRQQMAPDFVGPPEPPVRPEPGQRLLGPGPDVALPPGGGPLVTEVQPGEPGGLEPFRQGDVGRWGRPGDPARVREPGRFRVRDPGDPSDDLLVDQPEPTVRPEGPITPEVLAPEAKVEGELSFEEAEAQGKVKISRFPKSRKERGRQWYKENSLEADIIEEGGMKLDLKVSEERGMIMPNLGARRAGRGRNMFDPIRALISEDGMTVDQMYEVLKGGGRIPQGWTQADFMAALTDRKPGSGGTFPFEAEADIFDKLDAANEAQRPEGFEPEAPERLVPDVGRKLVPETRAAGQQPRTVEEAEADYQKGREQIKAMRDEPGYADTDFEALETENRRRRQENIDRINPPKPTTIGPGFDPEVPKADIPPKPKDTVTGDTLRHETLEEMEARQEVMDKGFEDQIDAFVEGYGEVGFQVPLPGEGRYAVLHESTRVEEGAWQTSYFDDRGPSGHHMSANWKDAVTDLQNQFRVDLSEARVKGQPNPDRTMTDMKGYDLEVEEARNRSLRGEAADPFRKAAEAPEDPRPGPTADEAALRADIDETAHAQIAAIKAEKAAEKAAEEPTVKPEGKRAKFDLTYPGDYSQTATSKFADQVKEIGGEWDGTNWSIPENKLAEARAIAEKLGFEWSKPKVAADEFPERVGMKVDEPTVTPEGPDLERIRKPRKKGAPKALFEDDPNVNLFMEDLKGTAEEPKVKPETAEKVNAKDIEVEGYESDLAGIKPQEKPVPVEELPLEMREERPEVQDYWATVADEYQRLNALVDRINLTGLNKAQRERTDAVYDEALSRISEIEERAGQIDDALPDPGELKPTPEEPKVEPERKGQVEIVGQAGFERENKLADDKAKLEMILSAKPNQQTAAGRKAIKDNARRERGLRADIAEQERLLRNDPEQTGMFAEDEPPLFRDEPKVEPETTKEEKAGLFSQDEPEVEPEGKKPPRVPAEEKEGLYSEEAAAEPTSRASDYVDSLVRAASKPGSPVTPELAGFAKAYLKWKTGAQAESAPRMPGAMAKSFRDLIDTLVESDKPKKPKGPPGQSTLHANPLGFMMDVWSKEYGPKLHKYLLSTEEPYGLVVKPWPEFVKWLFINRHRQPPEWVEAHQQWEWKTNEGATDSFKLGKEMSHKLSQKDQLKLGELLRGEATEADLRAMRDNPRWNEAIDAVKTARARFDSYGAQAATQGLLSEETFFKNYGRYMPRLYRRWEVDYDAQLAKYGASRPTRLDMDRWKKRQDIPEEVRVMMGEIKEPGYPVAKGLSQIIHDVETAKLFNKVADHPDWTFEPEKFWDMGKDPKQYTLMPESKALGRLSGKYVNKYIASVLNQMTKPRGQYSKVSRALVSEWKFNKVIFNPATHGRNMVSNTMLAYLSGLPPWRVDIYSKAMMELYQQKGPHYEAAKKQGLFSTTFAKGELNQLVDAWNSTSGGFYNRIGAMAEHFAQGEIAEGLGKVRPSSWKVGQRAAKIYQGEEAWFKLAKFIQETENGATPKAAAAAAQKALFDYTEVPPFVEWARTSPVGAPFITFTYKALPQIIETGITHPWRLGGLVASIYALEEGARYAMDIDEKQMDFIRRIQPDRMKGNPLGLGPKALLLPYKDKYGQLMFLDLTYILPWGDVGETGATGMQQGMPGYAGPLRAIAEVMLNTSGFTGADIYDPNDSQKEKVQAVSDYLYKFAMPSLAPAIPGVTEGGYGFERVWKSVTGKEDYFGRVSSPGTAIASAILGMKTNPLDPPMQLFFRKKDFEQAFDDLQADAFRVRNHKGLSIAEKQKQLKIIQDKGRKLRQAADTMIRGPRDERE